MVKKTYHPRGVLIDGYRVTKHPNYAIWAGMKARCKDQNSKNYGELGISYDPRWEHFASFCEDMGLRPSKQHTLDRVDNNGNYTKDNCRWATRTQQCLNRRMFSNNTTGYTGVVKLKSGRHKARFDENGVRYSLAGSFATAEDALAARLDLVARLERGDSVEHMLERPPRFDSSTGIRGITAHSKGGFLVRVTEKGERKYLGFFTTLETAKECLESWKREKKY